MLGTLSCFKHRLIWRLAELDELEELEPEPELVLDDDLPRAGARSRERAATLRRERCVLVPRERSREVLRKRYAVPLGCVASPVYRCTPEARTSNACVVVVAIGR